MPTKPIHRLALLAALASAVACDRESSDLPTAPGTTAAAHRSAAHRLTWSEPVNLGAPINTPFREIAAKLSPDGRSLYFTSNRPGGIGTGNDIWVARRASPRHPWQAPVNLGPIVNSAVEDGNASLSADGLMLFFTSGRPGGHGGADLYVSRRTDPSDDLGWGPPVNLGPLVNTPAGERGPELVVGSDGGTAWLYFNAGALLLQQSDLYAAPMTPTGEVLGPAQLVPGVNDPNANDAGQSVRKHGREILFWSERVGGSGSADLWIATRRSAHHAWSTPENLGAPPNTEFAEERPFLSHNGRTLFFDSFRPGGIEGSQDLWMSTRLDGEDDEHAHRESPQFSEWSAPVNLGALVNSTGQEVEVSLSRDQLSLYISSNRTGNSDLWVSQRARVDDPWGAPQNLGATINTAAREQAPFLTPDGHRLYFMSDRPGGAGGLDLYVAGRRDKRDDFAWQAPENLGSVVNSPAEENLPVLFEDDETETTTLYFGSNRDRPAGVPGDVYASTMQSDGAFGPVVLVDALSSPRRDRLHTIRRDGLEAFLGSDRPGPAVAPFDLWVATRDETSDPWSTPVNMGAVLNSAADDTPGTLSSDGTTLYIISGRAGTVGGLDIWVSTRTKLKHP